jgi:hypothetical protein
VRATRTVIDTDFSWAQPGIAVARNAATRNTSGLLTLVTKLIYSTELK